MKASPSFKDMNAAALARCPALLESWLPGGKLQGREFMCSDLKGGPGSSLSVNIETGQWADFATDDKGGDLVSLYAAIKGLKQGAALRGLADELGVTGGACQVKSKPKPKAMCQEWTAIMPIPADAPGPTFEHVTHGTPSAKWAYRDRVGNPLGYTCRFDTQTSDKAILPRTFCRGPEGRSEWRWQSFPEPRPLYGLDRLAQADAKASVLLVEGEKTADAAARLLDPARIVCMTWPGGSPAVGKVDLSPLAGRFVRIFPDADKPGFEAAIALAVRLKEAGVACLRIVEPPGGVASGWDLADAEAEDWTALRVREWLVSRDGTPEWFQGRAQEIFGIDIRSDAPEAEEIKSPQFRAAMRAIDDIGRENLIHAKGYFWRWRECGVWQRIEDIEIKQIVQRGEGGSKNMSGNFVHNAMSLIQNELYRPDHEFDQGEHSINCQNGELHWTGNEWELRPHQRESYRTTQIPVAYDAAAMAPRFNQFLGEVFSDDLDREDKAVIVCEALGYSLLSSSEFEKFFLLIGPGANGKSVLMETVNALVGSKNTVAVQPSQFENKFQRAHLHGKLVNLVTEIAEGSVLADAQVKAIVSGELTTAEHKHKPPFDFYPFCTCWFGTNHMPHTRDFSEALFRRTVILTFNRTFDETEQDKKLKIKLRAELPGILNLALEAMAGVLDRGHFTTAASCEVAKNEWRLQVDQVAQFVEDCCIVAPGNNEPSARMFQAYKDWAGEAGIRQVLGKKNFTERMCRLGAVNGRGTGGYRTLSGFSLIKDFAGK
jgi:putative DNA primase/helicase